MLEALILPPGGPLLCLGAGWVLRRRMPQIARPLLLAGALGLLLACLPWTAWLLMRSLEGAPQPARLEASTAGAVVVLGAGVEGDSPEWNGPAPGALSLQRALHAARVQRRTGLPLLVSGGRTRADTTPVARLMAEVLETDLDTEVAWVEDRSATTWENAAFSAELLAAAGIERVLLVTHAWHMPRAQQAFAAHGVQVEPAPLLFHGTPPRLGEGLLPSARALRDVSWALHEWLGRLAYALRTPDGG